MRFGQSKQTRCCRMHLVNSILILCNPSKNHCHGGTVWLSNDQRPSTSSYSIIFLPQPSEDKDDFRGDSFFWPYRGYRRVQRSKIAGQRTPLPRGSMMATFGSTPALLDHGAAILLCRAIAYTYRCPPVGPTGLSKQLQLYMTRRSMRE